MFKLTLILLLLFTTNAGAAINTIEAMVVQKIHIPPTEVTTADGTTVTTKNEVTAERWLVLLTVPAWGSGLTTFDSKNLFDRVEAGQKTMVSYSMVFSFGEINSCNYQINNLALPDGQVVNLWEQP